MGQGSSGGGTDLGLQSALLFTCEIHGLSELCDMRRVGRDCLIESYSGVMLILCLDVVLSLLITEGGYLIV